MTAFKARGLVLREYEAGESDKRIMLLCKSHGRIMVYARGARKQNSKFMAVSQLLTYGDYIIADGKQFLSLTQAEVIESFYAIRQDYDKLCHAGYVLEICEKTIPERTNCDEILRLALKTIQHINGEVIAPKLAVHVFLFRFFLINGIAPEMDCCCICGGDLNSSGLFCYEGMICHSCRGPKGMPLSLAAQEGVRHILKSDMNKTFLFRAGEAVINEIVLAALLCWTNHFSVSLNTDKLIH